MLISCKKPRNTIKIFDLTKRIVSRTSLLLCLCFALESKAQIPVISSDEAREDVTIFVEALDHHPGRFIYRSKSEIDSIKNILITGNTDSIALDKFYLKLLESLVFLKDGHTGLSLGEKYSATKRSSTTLPFRYKIIDNEIYIVDTLISGTSDFIHTKIVSINSISSDSILSVCYRYTSSDNDNATYRKRYNERILGQNVDFFFGPFDAYDIISINVSGDTIRKSIDGITDYETQINLNTRPPLSSTFDKENNIAILDVNTFSYRRIVDSDQDFHKFIDGFFKKVRKSKIENIVIDVRENWGGSGALAMCLFAYLSPEDFQWTEYSVTDLDGTEDFAKYTQYTDGHYNFLNTHDTLRLDNQRLKVTDGIESKDIQSCTHIPSGPKLKIKNITKNKYHGNVFVLTSGITFSAGAIFASKCAELGNASIVGEETGSAKGVFCGGSFLHVSLPNSGFIVELPTMERHIALSNYNIGFPVQPDFKLDQNIMNFIELRDPEIDKVYELMNGK